jgi:hypothetical protein
MLLLWVAASVSLMASALMLRAQASSSAVGVLLEKRLDLRSWEGFATLNAFGTIIVVGGLWSILAGGSGGGMLTAGIALKVIVIPFNGMFAYGLLAYRAATAVRVSAQGKMRHVPSSVAAADEGLKVHAGSSSLSSPDLEDPESGSLTAQELLE